MGHTIYSQIGAVLLMFCCGFAWLKGSQAEKLGAILIFVTNVMGDVASFSGGHNFPYFINFVLDLILALGLLLLAVRFSSLWLGVAMLLQGVELACYAMQSTGDGLQRHQYAHWVNILTSLMLLSVVAGTIASWRRRLRTRLRRGFPGRLGCDSWVVGLTTATDTDAQTQVAEAARLRY